MRFGALALVVVLIAAGASSASAAVSESKFPPHTVADLIAICAPAKDDPPAPAPSLAQSPAMRVLAPVPVRQRVSPLA